MTAIPIVLVLDLPDPLRRAAPPVEEQPEVHMARWRFVRSLGSGDVHLFGFPTLNDCVRLTTPVTVLSGDRVTTSSGRQYKLVGEPASDPEDLLSMSVHMLTSGLSFEYVTPESLLERYPFRWSLH